MNALTCLTDTQLETVLKGFNAFDNAITILIENGIIAEEEDCDMDALGGSVYQEVYNRAMEDAQFALESAVESGEMVRVIRPDGQFGYVPVDMD